MCGSAKINPAWLSDHINFDGGDETNLAQATFTVYDTDGKHHAELVHYSDAVSSTKSNDISSMAWCVRSSNQPNHADPNRWVGGFEQAALQMGFVWMYNGEEIGTVNGQFTAGWGSMGLSILTGLRATDEFTFTIDDMWAWCTAHGDHTPIIVGTKNSGTTTLSPHHAYTLMTSFVRTDNTRM
jgi:hypothetical protein